MGEDNQTYYDVKIKASKLLLENVGRLLSSGRHGHIPFRLRVTCLNPICQKVLDKQPGSQNLLRILLV